MNLAIKLPDNIYERILTFPVLHAIWRLALEPQKEKSDEIEEPFNLHIICHEGHLEVLNLLPIKAYYHELSDEELKNLFSVHRAIKNSKLNNIDAYISMSTGFVDASLGQHMLTRKRFGFNLSKNNIFLNYRVPYQEGRHFTEICVPLIETFFERKLEVIPKVCSRELKPIYSDWNDVPYVVINLPKDFDAIFESELMNFFILFKNYKFVFTCLDTDNDNVKNRIESFTQKLDTQNVFCVFDNVDWIEVAKIISFAKCTISLDGPFSLLASYCGAITFWINADKSLQQYGDHYFVGERRILEKPVIGDEKSWGKIWDEIYAYIAPPQDEEEE